MKKLIVTATALALVSAAGFSLAVAAPGEGDKSGPGMHAMADMGFMMDARIMGMKAALKLSPEQEKLWPTFEAAVRDAVRMRMEAMREHREDREKEGRPSPIARLEDISHNLAQAADELKKVADAAKPLYDSLDDTQKRHFGPLLMSLRGQDHGAWDMHEGTGGGGMGGPDGPHEGSRL